MIGRSSNSAWLPAYAVLFQFFHDLLNAFEANCSNAKLLSPSQTARMIVNENTRLRPQPYLAKECCVNFPLGLHCLFFTRENKWRECCIPAHLSAHVRVKRTRVREQRDSVSSLPELARKLDNAFLQTCVAFNDLDLCLFDFRSRDTERLGINVHDFIDAVLSSLGSRAQFPDDANNLWYGHAKETCQLAGCRFPSIVSNHTREIKNNRLNHSLILIRSCAACVLSKIVRASCSRIVASA